MACGAAHGRGLAALNAEADREHSNGKTALMVAAKQGDNDRIRDLIAKGADVNRTNHNGGTPIMYAALSGSSETVSLLLRQEADVDAAAKNGWTALMIATVKGYVDIAQLLLEHGARPNRPDTYSWTPLMRAVYERRLPMVRLLAGHPGTEVNQRGENGVTALHLAVAKGGAAIARLLLERGADPGIADDSGRTAVDFARKNNNSELVRLMTDGGG